MSIDELLIQMQRRQRLNRSIATERSLRMSMLFNAATWALSLVVITVLLQRWFL